MISEPHPLAATGDEWPLTLTINGQRHELAVAPWVTLLDLVRERLGLTGSKKGCDHGQCGACTMLVDGQRVNSCLQLAIMRDGAQVTTDLMRTHPKRFQAGQQRIERRLEWV